VLPPLSEAVQALPADVVASATQALMVKSQPYWQWSGLAGQTNKTITWSLAGTLPDWQGTPLAVAVLLENADQQSADYIGQQLLGKATQP
jgi:hypothetical protein